MMMVNIENCVRQCGAKAGHKFMLAELVRHMKELRDRTDKGDMSAIAEFFQLYRFDDNQVLHRARRPHLPDLVREKIDEGEALTISVRDYHIESEVTEYEASFPGTSGVGASIEDAITALEMVIACPAFRPGDALPTKEIRPDAPPIMGSME